MFADNVVVYVNPVWPLTAVSDVHVGDVPEYHRYKYGAVPPDGGVTVSVVDWPLTTTLFDAVGAADAVSEDSTVNVWWLLCTVSGPAWELSTTVTFASNVPAPLSAVLNCHKIELLLETALYVYTGTPPFDMVK